MSILSLLIVVFLSIPHLFCYAACRCAAEGGFGGRICHKCEGAWLLGRALPGQAAGLCCRLPPPCRRTLPGRAAGLCRVGPPGRCVAGASALPPHFAGSGRSAVRGQAAGLALPCGPPHWLPGCPPNCPTDYHAGWAASTLPPKLLLASPHRRAGPVLRVASALPWGGF